MFRVNFLPLQSFHEALATGIVVRSCRSTHTGNHLVLPQLVHVFARCVLQAADRPEFLYHDVREFTSQPGPVNLRLVQPESYRPLVLAAPISMVSGQEICL
jgi:hypothetical protein